MYRATPSPIAPLLIAAFDGKVVAYHRTNGQTVWSYGPTGPSRIKAPRPTHAEVHGARVFVLVGQLRKKGTFSDDTIFAEVTALDYGTGRALWTQVVDREQMPTAYQATLLVDGEQVVVAHADAVAVFAAENGAPQWVRPSEHGDGGSHLASVELVVPGQTARPVLL